MKKILFYNADDGGVARAILAGCYKYGFSTLLRKECTSMTSVIEVEEGWIDARAVGRERTETEKKRRHIYGDKDAKFSGGKQLCILGDVCGTVTTFATKDNLVAEIYD